MHEDNSSKDSFWFLAKTKFAKLMFEAQVEIFNKRITTSARRQEKSLFRCHIFQILDEQFEELFVFTGLVANRILH